MEPHLLNWILCTKFVLTLFVTPVFPTEATQCSSLFTSPTGGLNLTRAELLSQIRLALHASKPKLSSFSTNCSLSAKDNENNYTAAYMHQNCKEYMFSTNRSSYRVDYYFFGQPQMQFNNSSGANEKLTYEITLASHLSFDRLLMVSSIARVWDGPIVFSYYGNISDIRRLNELLQAQLPPLRNRTNIIVHVVHKAGVHYPINFLRNVAVASVRTNYVYAIDADFLPRPGMHARAQLTINRLEKLRGSQRSEKVVYVVQSFELLKNDTLTRRLPTSKQALIERWQKTRDIAPFHLKRRVASAFVLALGDYCVWANTNRPYNAPWRLGYEPYFIARTSQIPTYDEHFVGYYNNKLSFAIELHLQGYDFVVLPEEYMIHIPHSRANRRRYRNLPPIQKQCRHFQENVYCQRMLMKYGSRADDDLYIICCPHLK